MPFECPRCVVDTNVLSDFYESDCLPLIWQIFPGGVWIDPYVCEELKAKYELDVQQELARLQLPYNFTNDYEPEHLVEMAEIKTRRRALKYADISCVVNARIHEATCLSADNAVYKTCGERGVKAARHGGILQEAVRRSMLTKHQALAYFQRFLDSGLTMKPSIREQLIVSFT
ncbi:PIN domain-containing protein [Gibbsiella quercinecans]|uniref:PIN domain-containing protein n=1 Tax=Gibbsiella quercinecans TaxID=929813 RepID=UPI000EF13872|nr:PIN domain-containing protein [Gibbsiella quercinecans]RLM12853.1 hypothetical protein BIY31_00270 [Gibbsiella quercinecans]